MPVGLGALEDGGFAKVGEATDRKVRAELLDEGLDILTGLWSGKPFHFQGKHYHLDEMTFQPPPVQSPRIPIRVVRAWPSMKSMQRVLRYDGLLPTKLTSSGAIGQLEQVLSLAQSHQSCSEKGCRESPAGVPGERCLGDSVKGPLVFPLFLKGWLKMQ